jgi:GNAT superfamily N-acetyltransferase
VTAGAAPREVLVRVAGAGDVAAIAALRWRWSSGAGRVDPAFAEEVAAWLEADGERRTTWLALTGEVPVGMASLFEYRRMPRPGRPHSRWGYVGNMFVREDARNRGIGTALLGSILRTADDRGYARLVLSPSDAALSFYRRAGFLPADGHAGEHHLLVRPGRAHPPSAGPI